MYGLKWNEHLRHLKLAPQEFNTRAYCKYLLKPLFLPGHCDKSWGVKLSQTISTLTEVEFWFVAKTTGTSGSVKRWIDTPTSRTERANCFERAFWQNGMGRVLPMSLWVASRCEHYESNRLICWTPLPRYICEIVVKCLYGVAKSSSLRFKAVPRIEPRHLPHVLFGEAVPMHTWILHSKQNHVYVLTNLVFCSSASLMNNRRRQVVKWGT